MRHTSSSIAPLFAFLTARVAFLPSVADRSLSKRTWPLGRTALGRRSQDDLVSFRTPATVVDGPRELAVQHLTLFLAGMTAGDYLASVRDPEPRALGHHLKAVAARAEPLGHRVDVELVWDQTPPALRDAAMTAGFPLTPEVVGLRPTGL